MSIQSSTHNDGTSSLMQQMITKLLIRFSDGKPRSEIEVHISESGNLLVEELVRGKMIKVSLVKHDQSAQPISCTTMYYWIADGPWIPYMSELVRTDRLACASIEGGRLVVTDESIRRLLVTMSEGTARNMQTKGWLDKAILIDT